jgi:DNA-binding transcriptional ArsR family regulator
MRIVGSLREQSRSVSEIIAETGLEQTCVSHCLRKLTDGNFVTVRRDGKRRIYSLHKNMTPLLALIERHVEGTP